MVGEVTESIRLAKSCMKAPLFSVLSQKRHEGERGLDERRERQTTEGLGRDGRTCLLAFGVCPGRSGMASFCDGAGTTDQEPEVLVKTLKSVSSWQVCVVCCSAPHVVFVCMYI